MDHDIEEIGGYGTLSQRSRIKHEERTGKGKDKNEPKKKKKRKKHTMNTWFLWKSENYFTGNQASGNKRCRRNLQATVVRFFRICRQRLSTFHQKGYKVCISFRRL